VDGCGGWKTAEPFGLFDIDLEKMGLRSVGFRVVAL